jgi:hypothetical protein
MMRDLSKMLLDNKTLTIVLSMLIVLYSALAAPALPNSVILFFDTWYGKLIFMFLIAYVASHNVQVALVIAILFFILLNMATKLEVERFRMEKFEDKKTLDMSTEMTNKLKSIVCGMATDEDKNMTIKDLVMKNMDKVKDMMGMSHDNELKDLLDNMPEMTVDSLCGNMKQPQEKKEMKEKYENSVLQVEAADLSLMGELGAPVDF